MQEGACKEHSATMTVSLELGTLTSLCLSAIGRPLKSTHTKGKEAGSSTLYWDCQNVWTHLKPPQAFS